MEKQGRRQRALRELWVGGLTFLLAVFTFLAALLLPFVGKAHISAENQLWQAYQQGELIRLHVLADSDEPEAQRVKLKVRDAILQAFGTEFGGEQSCEQIYHTLGANVEEFQRVAQSCARAEGFGGEVRAEVGVLRLPAKQYGRVVLPEGEYKALRVTLGSGKGRNWWCVLFPQLCLAISEDGGAQPDIRWDSAQILQNWLLLSP